MNVHIGFTGTRKGMSDTQKRAFEFTMRLFQGVLVFHHGDCEGADKEAHRILKPMTWVSIRKHPAGSNPLQRDREIVAAVSLLIAAPSGDLERLRSGTWATVRYARAKGIPIVMLPRR